MSIASTALYDKGQPYHNSSTNTLATSASLSLCLTYALALLLINTQYGDDLVSGTVITILCAALVPVGYQMSKSDAKEKMKSEEKRHKLYDTLRKFKVGGRKSYDVAWQGYVNQASRLVYNVYILWFFRLFRRVCLRQPVTTHDLAQRHRRTRAQRPCSSRICSRSKPKRRPPPARTR